MRLKKAVSTLLAAVMVAASALGSFPATALAEEAVQNLSSSLQIGTPTSLKGFAQRKFDAGTITSDEYIVSFDYMYPEGEQINGNIFWSYFDATKGRYLDRMNQNGDTISAYGTSIKINGGIWYNFVLHFKGNKLSMYVDGVPVLFGNSYEVQRDSSDRIGGIGYIGDPSSADHGGMGYYDNFKVVENGAVKYSATFDNNNKEGFVFYTDVSVANPPVNCDPGVLESIQLSSSQIGFSVGDELALSEIDLKAFLDNGKQTFTGFGQTTMTVSNSNVMEIVERNGEKYLSFKSNGYSMLNVQYQLDGVTKTASLLFAVSNSTVMSGIQIANTEDKLIKGQSVPLELLAIQSDNTTSPILTTEYPMSVSSSNTNVLQVSQDNGAVTITAVNSGSASIQVSYQLGGYNLTAVKTFPVTAPTSVAVETVDIIYATDKIEVELTGINLSDGTTIGAEGVSSINYTPEDSTKINVQNGKLVAVAPCENSKVTLTATCYGVTLTKDLFFDVKALSPSKTKASYYTSAKVATARQNIEQYSWAAQVKQDAITQADKYLALGYDKLWSSVTSQLLPRSYGVNQPLGCLKCGKEIDNYGNYPYQHDHANNPWKLTCPNCHYQFPTNDFESYYELGLNEKGEFIPELAKSKNDELVAAGETGYLVNVLYPEMGEDWGVDDGYGYRDPISGKLYTFIPYYIHWALWYSGFVEKVHTALSNAYLYTGDQRYADAAIILLDRIADVYPDMDVWPYKYTEGYLHSNGNSGRGKVIGSIWETGLANNIMYSYDRVFPAIATMSAEAKAFLASKDPYRDKSNPDRIKVNFEDGVLRQIYPAVKNSQIRGNNGMHQATLALAAVVMDSMPESQEWIEFNNQAGTTTSTAITGGNLLTTFIEDVDRDGHGNESAPGYNALWLSTFLNVANIMSGYELTGSTIDVDLFTNVKFKKMFYASYPLILSDIYSANIGDTSSTGNPNRSLNISQLLIAYQKYQDPLLAQLIYLGNNNSTAGLKLDIFSENPESIGAEIQAVIDQHGEIKLDDTNLTGYGFAALRDGESAFEPMPEGVTYLCTELSVLEQSKQVKYFESNGMLQFEADTIGDKVTYGFSFTGDATKSFDLGLRVLLAPSYGVYKITLNGAVLAEQQSFGGSGITNLNFENISLLSGQNTLAFECVGTAGGYKMSFSHLIIAETASSTPTVQQNTQRDIWTYYGRNTGHGHKDTLNLGLHAFKLDLMPDLGYPEYADSSAHRVEWVDNTISHNTVVVNNSKNNINNEVSQPKHFDSTDFVKLFDIDAKVYTATEQYRRTTAMIKIDDANSYVVDLFRVKGGSDHRYSFHSANGTVSTSGLDLVSQTDGNGNYVGSYAGANVEWKKYTTSTALTNPDGNTWLGNVDRDSSPASKFSVDWNVNDTWGVLGNGTGAATDIHLKLTMLGNYDEVALADGLPPRNKPGNPESLRYALVKNTGTNLESIFTSVIEPYKGSSNITSIEAIPVTLNGSVVSDNEARAIRVTLSNGRVDTIVNALDTTKTYRVNNEFDFKGFYGVYSSMNGTVVNAYINDGTQLGTLQTKAAVTGTISDFTRDLSVNNEITVVLDEAYADLNNLVGRYIYAENDGVRNASYRIKSAELLADGKVKLGIGDVTTIRKFVDKFDFSKGYVYDLAVGANFTIPLSASMNNSAAAQ